MATRYGQLGHCERLAGHRIGTLRIVPKRTIGVAVDPKRNSLNFLRLVLAFCVVYSHASDLGWWGYRNVVVNGNELGTIAVYGFFGISGYLIAGSATRNSVGRYLWQRFLRIVPALWVCLVVTAFAFGAIALAINPLPHCGYVCYLKLHPGPFSFVYSNALVKLNQLNVAPPNCFWPMPRSGPCSSSSCAICSWQSSPSSGCCDTVGGSPSSR